MFVRLVLIAYLLHKLTNSKFQGIVGPQGVAGNKGDRGDTGLTGPQGECGPQGPLAIGGAVYVCWGRTVCPSDQGTELVYSGRAGGSCWSHQGGGANHLCLPDDPDHLQYGSGTQEYNIYGVEYRLRSSQPLGNVNDHNVPCAVCHVTTRATLLMIPAKVNCPTNWTTEYTGYLMTEHFNHLRSTYECVDKDPESVSGLNDGDDCGELMEPMYVCVCVIRSGHVMLCRYHLGHAMLCRYHVGHVRNCVGSPVM